MADAPEFYYRLNDTSGPPVGVVEASGLDGYSIGAYRSGPLVANQSYVRLGAGDNIRPASDDALNTKAVGYSNKTHEMWFNADSTADTQILWEQGGEGNGLSVIIDNGKLYGTCWVDQAKGSMLSAPISADTVYHVVLTQAYSAGTMSLWVNGVKVDTGVPDTAFSTLNPHGSKVGIGDMVNGTGGPFFNYVSLGGDGGYQYQGLIGEIAHYNYILAEDRIQAHYKAGQENLF